MDKNIEKFIYELTKKEFVVFAGSGIGVITERGPTISWKMLMQGFEETVPDIVEENIDNINEEDYPDIAQKIFNKLKERNEEEKYYEILAKKLCARICIRSSQQVDIFDTAKHVVTTNFDDTLHNALERALEDKPNVKRTLQYLPELKIRELSKEYSLSYLHGRINEKCLVFKRNDYRKFYPTQFGETKGSDNLENFLRHLYEEHTIVFIGFSFRDRCLLKALEIINDTIKKNDHVGNIEKKNYKTALGDIQHYALLKRIKHQDKLSETGLEKKEDKQKTEEALEQRLRALKIRVIRYNEYSDWQIWFDKIRKLKRTRQEEIKNVMDIAEPY